MSAPDGAVRIVKRNRRSSTVTKGRQSLGDAPTGHHPDDSPPAIPSPGQDFALPPGAAPRIWQHRSTQHATSLRRQNIYDKPWYYEQWDTRTLQRPRIKSEIFHTFSAPLMLRQSKGIRTHTMCLTQPFTRNWLHDLFSILMIDYRPFFLQTFDALFVPHIIV